MILSLGLVLSIGLGHAAPGVDAPDYTAFERGLADAATRAFEKRLAQPLGPKSIESLLSAQFRAESDRAYLARSGVAGVPPYKLRSFSRDGEVYTLTAANGRAFTLTSTDAGRTLRINGVRIAWRGLTLEAYLTQLDAALHRTFVTLRSPWSWPAPSEAAAIAAPGFFGPAAYVALYTYRYVTGKNVYQQLTERLSKANAVCESERGDSRVPFGESATQVTFEAVKSQYAEYVAKHQVPRWCNVGLPNDPTEGGNPRYENADLRQTCATARQFVACAEAFRADAADRPGAVNLIQKSSSSSSAR